MGGEGAQGGTAGGEGGKPTGTADANVAELQAKITELTAQHQQALAEKSGYEETKQKLAEAQQMLAQVLAERESGQPPTTGPGRGPFAAIDTELANLHTILRTAPNDPLTQRAIRDAERERDALQWELTKQSAWASISQVKAEALRDRAWQMFLTGAFATVEAAVYAARGAETFEQERTKADEEAKKKAETRPDTATGGGTPPADKGKTMTGSEYTKFLHEKAGTKEAQELIAKADGGMPIDWTR